MKDLISKIGELKLQDSVIENIVNRVNTLENMPNETKKQLAEYLHNFEITDNRLWSLNKDQVEFHKDCLNYLQQFEIILANKQVVVDENVINDIKNLVQAETGFNLRDYVSNKQKELITHAFNNLTNMQQDIVNKQQQLIDKMQQTITIQNKINAQMNKVDNHLGEYLHGIIQIVALFGGLSLLLTIPNFVLAFDRHPVLTILGSIIAVVTCIFSIYAAFYKDDESDDDDD
ncbi:hypothetical protein C5O77_01140 (plasmid) [Limosilactobacillus reuteri]|uniref:Uncharacterized protein n=1 Tax=Limosilactobacillus reuteri TaxID=1598 RepID=A0A3M6SGK5_LIMRT|nr:hypothetical protein [Limosilactobacillus reuteri]RMX26577.1 hypothetical protein C5O77_01140 [Limosilactobacillus reuteri]